MSIAVLTPTGTLGYGYGEEALKRGLTLGPQVIAVDAGSTDPGPYYLGAASALVSRISTKRELRDLIGAGREARIPVIVGSAAGAGSRWHVDWTVDIVREVARELGVRFRLAWIYADIPVERARDAVAAGDVRDFEAAAELAPETVDNCTALVAQMGHEPFIEALENGADVIIAGRACDESTVAAFPIAKGGDKALAIHMGKILECGAFSAEPFAMDVMVGTLNDDHFLLEPGSAERRASATSVAAHSLYERENPFRQYGPGYALDLSGCSFEQTGERRVRVSGSTFEPTEDYWVKLEGVEVCGYRTICIAGVRCPTMTSRIDGLLEDVRAHTLEYFASNDLHITYHVYGRDGVMGGWEPQASIRSHELGLVIDVVADEQELARAACHHASGRLLHMSYDGQYNTSGNLAFPYSPSEIDAGPAYRWSVYHLMRAESPTELFPICYEDV